MILPASAQRERQVVAPTEPEHCCGSGAAARGERRTLRRARGTIVQRIRGGIVAYVTPVSFFAGSTTRGVIVPRSLPERSPE